jgi:hypothetical protein
LLTKTNGLDLIPRLSHNDVAFSGVRWRALGLVEALNASTGKAGVFGGHGQKLM